MIELLAGLILATAPANCSDDILAWVVRTTDVAEPYVLVTRSGRAFQLLGQDFIDPRSWRSGDPLRLCVDVADPRTTAIQNLSRQERLMGDERIQVMAGPEFQALLQGAARECPTSLVRYAHPAALLDAEETFAEGLGRNDQRRLTQAGSSGDAACAGRNGASCPAAQELRAIESVGLMKRFTAAVCAFRAASW
jgi:hypothetical protein